MAKSRVRRAKDAVKTRDIPALRGAFDVGTGARGGSVDPGEIAVGIESGRIPQRAAAAYDRALGRELRAQGLTQTQSREYIRNNGVQSMIRDAATPGAARRARAAIEQEDAQAAREAATARRRAGRAAGRAANTGTGRGRTRGGRA